jgi:hypothetical protein
VRHYTVLCCAVLYSTVLCWLCCAGRRLVSLIGVEVAGQLYLFSTSTRNLRSRSSPRGRTTSKTAETPDSEHWYHPHYEESRPSKESAEPSLSHKAHSMLSEEELLCLPARPKIQDSGLKTLDPRFRALGPGLTCCPASEEAS